MTEFGIIWPIIDVKKTTTSNTQENEYTRISTSNLFSEITIEKNSKKAVTVKHALTGCTVNQIPQSLPLPVGASHFFSHRTSTTSSANDSLRLENPASV